MIEYCNGRDGIHDKPNASLREIADTARHASAPAAGEKAAVGSREWAVGESGIQDKELIQNLRFQIPKKDKEKFSDHYGGDPRHGGKKTPHPGSVRLQGLKPLAIDAIAPELKLRPPENLERVSNV